MTQNTNNPSKTLYLFIDESGNFDFSSRGTKYFLLSSIATFRPSLYKEKILDFKYDLLKNGYDKECFHATEDEQVVRDKFFSFVEEMGEHLDVYSVIIQKNKANPTLFQEVYTKKGRVITRNTGIKLYEKTCQSLLKYIFQKHERKDVDKNLGNESLFFLIPVNSPLQNPLAFIISIIFGTSSGFLTSCFIFNFINSSSE